MIYFGYPLDIHGWKPKPETESEPEPKNRGRKTNTKPETQKTETRGYPHRTRSTAISKLKRVLVGLLLQIGLQQWAETTAQWALQQSDGLV